MRSLLSKGNGAAFCVLNSVEFCLTYTTGYCSVYERPRVLILNPLRRSKSILQLSIRTVFVEGGIRYPPRDEVFMGLQVPTGDGDTRVRSVRASAKTVFIHNLFIKFFLRSLKNHIV